MTKFLFLLFLSLNTFAIQEDKISVATVDSGFGGFFTAKAIEEKAYDLSKDYLVRFDINHYGDTLNAPYGEKTPKEIAKFASDTIIQAHKNGAKYVFLACNTASSQFDKIKEILRSQPATAAFADTTYSIIQSSVEDLKMKIDSHLKDHDHVNVALLVTAATMKSDIYPREIQKIFGIKKTKTSQYNFFKQPRWYKKKTEPVESGMSSLEIKVSNKTITVYQMAPGNWVEMIEHQASNAEKKAAIPKDLEVLTAYIPKNIQFDMVAEFCTHFPVFHEQIISYLEKEKRVTKNTNYIQQGELFANMFKSKVMPELQKKTRTTKLTQKEITDLKAELEPVIYISGDNKSETINLTKSIFPKQQKVEVKNYK